MQIKTHFQPGPDLEIPFADYLVSSRLLVRMVQHLNLAPTAELLEVTETEVMEMLEEIRDDGHITISP